MRDSRTTQAGDDAGYTLTELLVAMGVFSVVIALATSGLISLLTTTRGATDRADAQAEIRLGLADIGKQMRSGNVLFSPKDEPGYVPSCQSAADGSDTGTCMRIYTQTFGIPRCVQWQVLQVEPGGGGAELRTRSWSIDWQTTGDVSDWRTVARGLSLDAAHLPFTLQGAATPTTDASWRSPCSPTTTTRTATCPSSRPSRDATPATATTPGSASRFPRNEDTDDQPDHARAASPARARRRRGPRGRYRDGPGRGGHRLRHVGRRHPGHRGDRGERHERT
ncbi:PulJ/GspJ family protein [Cellulomonas soli]